MDKHGERHPAKRVQITLSRTLPGSNHSLYPGLEEPYSLLDDILGAAESTFRQMTYPQIWVDGDREEKTQGGCKELDRETRVITRLSTKRNSEKLFLLEADWVTEIAAASEQYWTSNEADGNKGVMAVTNIPESLYRHNSHRLQLQSENFDLGERITLLP